MIYSYYCGCGFLEENEKFRVALGSVSYDRQARVQKAGSATNKRVILGAGLLLSYALEKHFGLNEREQFFRRGVNGRPYMPEHGNVFFSVSHSGEMAAATVGDKPCGVDIERMRILSDSFAKRCYTEEERHICRSPEDIISVWTLKEAIVKAAGESIAGSHLAFSALPGKGSTFFHGNTYFFRQCRTGDYFISVSAQSAEIAQPSEVNLNLFTTEECL